MDLRELGYFVAAFEERSISAAARRCFVSQPSVSEALASLEHALSARLFVRHRKGVSPTEAGERLHPLAQRLLADARSMRALFEPVSTRRRLTFGLMRSIDVARTRELLALIAPDPTFELHVVDAAEPCDMRIVSRSMLGPREVFVPLWEERYVVAVPRRHPLAARKLIRASELIGQRLVSRCHCEHAALLEGGARFDIVAVAQTEEWALALVAAGVGIALVPAGVVSPTDDLVVLPIQDVRAAREVGLAHGGGPAATPEILRLVAILSARRRPGTKSENARLPKARAEQSPSRAATPPPKPRRSAEATPPPKPRRSAEAAPLRRSRRAGASR